jgi:hypothetical protein
MTIRYVLTILAALALIAAGCGGSDDEAAPNETNAENEPTEGPPSKAEFIEQADAICKQFIEDTSSLSRRHENLGGITAENAAEAAELFDEIAESRRQTTEELRRLEPPRGDAEVIDDYLSAREIVDSLIASLASAYRELDPERSEALAGELESDRERARDIAEDYGFKACGQIDE